MRHDEIDLWVDTFEPGTDGFLRVRLARAKKPASIGDGELVSFACVEGIEGSPSIGAALLKPLTGPGGASAAPKLADDRWCDVTDE